jgi:acyl-CoA thioesterase I
MMAAPSLAMDQTCQASLNITALGDSLTAGYGLPSHESLPAQLETKLKNKNFKIKIENAGVSGDTTAGGLARVEWSIAPQTQGVMLALGANDMLRGLSIEEAQKNLETIIEILQKKKISVFLIGMKANLNYGEKYRADFDALFPRLAQKYNTAFYPFLLDKVALNPALNLKDGLHPNAQGISIIAESLMPHVERWLLSLPACKA